MTCSQISEVPIYPTDRRQTIRGDLRSLSPGPGSPTPTSPPLARSSPVPPAQHVPLASDSPVPPARHEVLIPDRSRHDLSLQVIVPPVLQTILMGHRRMALLRQEVITESREPQPMFLQPTRRQLRITFGLCQYRKPEAYQRSLPYKRSLA